VDDENAHGAKAPAEPSIPEVVPAWGLGGMSKAGTGSFGEERTQRTGTQMTHK